MNIVLLGAPGAGKGTQAVNIAAHFDLKLVGTGDMFRKEISKKSGLGMKVQSYVQSGKLVPDDLVFDIIKNNLSAVDWDKGFLFDGFPRTVNQAQALDAMVAEQDKNIDAVLFIDVDDAILIERLVNRLMCRSCNKIFGKTMLTDANKNICPSCKGELYQRADDTHDTVTKRLKEYREKTQPILQYYGVKVKTVNGSLTIQKVYADLIAEIERSAVQS